MFKRVNGFSARDGAENALLRLLDDPSPVVRAALVGHFENLGDTGLLLLNEAAEEGNGPVSKAAIELLRAVGARHPIDDFLQFIRSFNYDLETGCGLMARVVDKASSVTQSYLELERLATRCRQLILSPSSPVDQMRIINRVLFHESGFARSGRRALSHEIFLLPSVLQRRRGSSEMLSVIYILVAERIGLELDLYIGEHFWMPGCSYATTPTFVDVASGGVFLTLGELARRLRVSETKPVSRDFFPATTGCILQYCCSLIAQRFSEASNLEMSALFDRFICAFEETYRAHE